MKLSKKSKLQKDNMSVKVYEGGSSCPKCGHDDVRVHYEEATADRWDKPNYHELRNCLR